MKNKIGDSLGMTPFGARKEYIKMARFTIPTMIVVRIEPNKVLKITDTIRKLNMPGFGELSGAMNCVNTATLKERTAHNAPISRNRLRLRIYPINTRPNMEMKLNQFVELDSAAKNGSSTNSANIPKSRKKSRMEDSNRA
ncbi:hypothetical protein KFU94_62165 [Chloroflexi bacterium TSY]|nr:hypothetical protein [Chloroflexi bacterium TSY]